VSAWPTLLIKGAAFSHFRELTDTGTLTLSFDGNYCGLFDKTGESEAPVIVRPCTPHINPTHPFAHPYQDTTYENYNFAASTGEVVDSIPINPLEATHSCCIGVPERPDLWDVKEEGAECYVNPEVGCYGGVDFYAFTKTHLTKEQQIGTCDGVRGNTCPDTAFKLYERALTCGNSDMTSCVVCPENADASCKGIPFECQDESAWSIVSTQAGRAWCSGTLGCEKLCKSEIVSLVPGFPGPNFNFKGWVNQQVDNEEAVSEAGLKFQCGCTDEQEGNPCDANFNGVFAGTCGLVATNIGGSVEEFPGCVGDDV